MIEVWKDVPGYEGYQVSNQGNVRSLRYRGKNCIHLLSPGTDKKGYKRVVLSKNKKQTTFQIHRLVATAFIPNPQNLPQVNHKDKNTGNNRVDNLEWCSVKYNIDHAQGRLGVFEKYMKEHDIKQKVYWGEWYRKKRLNVTKIT